MSIRVCLVVEGSYPFITGGVSAWVHQLIQGIPDVDFVLFTISPSSDQPVRYELPSNVVGHTDIVISDKYSSTRKPRGRGALFEELREMHLQLEGGSLPRIDEMVERIPEGAFFYRDAMKSDVGWEMISSRHQDNNPVYPFSDFFWAWKSSHDMMFTVLGSKAPRADLYHAVSTGYAGLAATCAKIRRGRPFLLTEHGLYHKEREMEINRATFIKGYQRDMWVKIYNNLSRLAYLYADLIISLFEYNRRIQIELGAPEAKTLVIPNGIDTKHFSGIERTRRNGFHVGLVGRVVPIKDIKTFISTAKVVSTLIPDATFHCIGPTDEDPEYYEDCKRLVQSLKLSERFHFTGRADVREYYSFLDVLLLTSVREAQPLVILEAFCAGVPVVSTGVGNVPELLDFDGRFLASSKDPEKIAAGVQFVHDNPGEVAKLVERNRERVEQFYDREAVFDRYREFYRSYGAS